MKREQAAAAVIRSGCLFMYVKFFARMQENAVESTLYIWTLVRNVL